MANCSSSTADPPIESIIHLNVGGKRFATSSNTLSWIPDTFFTSLISGRMQSVRDETGAIFIDRDPDVFKVILNYLRSKQVDLSTVSISTLKHEAQYFGLTPLVRRLTLCEELDVSSCGSVFFHGMIPAPAFDQIESSSSNSHKKERNANNSNSSTPRHCGHSKKGSADLNKYIKNELLELAKNQKSEQLSDSMRVHIIQSHNSSLIVAYSHFVCVYREWNGWSLIWTSPRMKSHIKHVAINSKINQNASERLIAVSFHDETIGLWCVYDNGKANKKGTFSMGVSVDNLFFVGTQMVALSRVGKVGIWHSATQNWQQQDMAEITCFDTAGSSLLLGCTNGCLYYIDMQKFPLRMKDNDLLVTELYHDPNDDCITAISVFLTPKTSVCGNWIEIAYGTIHGAVRVIVQHPETVGHGPQLFQSYNVHNSAITKISLTTGHLISVCAEYNHVRSWIVTRFRGMISTQPGTMSLASFKVLTLDSTDETTDRYYNTPGPYGDQDTDQVFVQRLVPNASQLFVRLASTGERVCTIQSVDTSPISAFIVHECDGSSRIGNRPRRYLFCGTWNGNVQMWDLTTAIDLATGVRSPNVATAQSMLQTSPGNQNDVLKPTLTPNPRPFINTPQTLAGPTPQELLNLIDECDICCSSLSSTPCPTPNQSFANLSAFTPK